MKHLLCLCLATALVAAPVVWAENAGGGGKERIFVFVAHPDDTIACAGTMFLLKDQFELHVGVMTHGERGLGEQGCIDGTTKAIRTKEEESAAALVGAKVHWFDEIDGDCYPNRDVCRKVADLLRELKPRAVIGMWPLDYHHDHAMSAACLIKAVGLAGMRDLIEFYFMEESYDTRTFHPAYYVDITEVVERKREFIRRHVCQNRGDAMCRTEMEDGEARAQRCASWMTNGNRGNAERFAVWDGKPQGHRCIFTEMAPPKGWRQDWSAARLPRRTPENATK